MTERQLHNFRLLRARLRGLTKRQRDDARFLIRHSALGSLLLGIRDAYTLEALADVSRATWSDPVMLTAK